MSLQGFPAKTGRIVTPPPPAPPPVVYYKSDETTSPKFAQAFAAGCGGYVRHVSDRLHDGDFAAFCTPAVWPLLDAAIIAGRTVYYGDHGYYRRGKYYRVAVNGIQYQPQLRSILQARKIRYINAGQLAAPRWRDNGRHILVCPNSDIYHSRFGTTQDAWVADVVAQITRVTDRPIVIRTKQDAKTTPIAVALRDAWLTVVYSSNAAVDSLAHGVPICVLAPFASTWSMGVHDPAQVESPIYPDYRDLFLWHLAEAQWTLGELRSGAAWQWLQDHAPAARSI